MHLYLPIASVFVAISLWWVISTLKLVSAYYLPPPYVVFTKLVTPSFLLLCGEHLYFTLIRSFIGYLFAAFIGIILGLAIGRSFIFSRLSVPIIEFLRPLPSSAIIPLALLFLGLGNTMQVAVIIFGCTWPILVSTAEGAKSVDPTFLDVAKLLNFNRFQRLKYVLFPSTAPFIASGLRTSLSVSLILAVTAEMIVGHNGIGFYIIDLERSFMTADMYAAIIVLGTAGFFLNDIFIRIQRKIIYWL